MKDESNTLLMERHNSDELGVDRKIILKLVCGKLGLGCEVDSVTV